MVLLGTHLHQFPAQREAQLLELRQRSATVLDLDAGYYIGRLDRPGMHWTIRLYHPDMPSRLPEEIAGAVIVEAEKWRNTLGDRLMMQAVNEINLGIEWGNNTDGKFQEWLESDAGFLRRADIHMRIARSIKQRAPWVKIAGPFDSPGHQDVDGRQEIRLLAQMGYFDYVDAFGGHYYAEGVDRGGFDAPDKEWYADRVLKARAILDECGYAHLPIIIGECNRKDIDQGDIWGEYDRYLARIDAAVERVDWFVWSSPDASFGTFQLWKASNPVVNFNHLADKYAGSSPPSPEVPAEPPPTPATGQIALIEAKYNISHTDGAAVVLAGLTVRPDPNNIEAFGPADLLVQLNTKDGLHPAEGMGHAELSGFGQPAKYHPTVGQQGYYYATCGDARVDGLGWPFGVPGDTGSHTNIVPTFARKVAEPPPVEPPPIEPPPAGEAWFGAFAGFAAAHPWVGAATGAIVYAPSAWTGAMQEGENAYLVWNGATVFAIAKPNAAAVLVAKENVMTENYGLGSEFNEAHWRKPEQELIDGLVAGGMPVDQATVAVRAVKNAIGERADDPRWTRVQAPGAGGPNDPSPDSLDAARAQEPK